MKATPAYSSRLHVRTSQCCHKRPHTDTFTLHTRDGSRSNVRVFCSCVYNGFGKDIGRRRNGFRLHPPCVSIICIGAKPCSYHVAKGFVACTCMDVCVCTCAGYVSVCVLGL